MILEQLISRQPESQYHIIKFWMRQSVGYSPRHGCVLSWQKRLKLWWVCQHYGQFDFHSIEWFTLCMGSSTSTKAAISYQEMKLRELKWNYAITQQEASLTHQALTWTIGGKLSYNWRDPQKNSNLYTQLRHLCLTTRAVKRGINVAVCENPNRMELGHCE